MALQTATEGMWGCPFFVDSQTGLLELSGRVVSSEPEKLTIDSCSPLADCAPLINTLDFKAPGLSLTIPVDSYVSMQVRVDIPMGCSHELMIQNLPEWDGLPNPVFAGRHLWLAAADGVIATLPDAPFAVTALPLGCSPEPQRDAYSLLFTSPSSKAEVSLKMGESSDWYWQPTSMMTVRNLRSFETGQVDDYWNWGFWLTGELAIDE
jgi:hypothetical protein